MPESKKQIALLGLVFLTFLLFSSYENTIFFNLILRYILQNQILAIGMLFLHNVLAVSLIFLGMSFYVSLVKSGFFKRGKYYYIVLKHPQIFALVFTVVIVFLSILRGCIPIYGEVSLEVLPIILITSIPLSIVEGYGIYIVIEKTLSQIIRVRDLAIVYCIFLIAAVMEVAFINTLITSLKIQA